MAEHKHQVSYETGIARCADCVAEMKTTVRYELHLELEVSRFPEGGWSEVDDVVEAVVANSTAREAISDGIAGSEKMTAEVTMLHLEWRKIGMSCRKEEPA